ncbi:MAG: enoyl-CoA hydratase/isomerase family protein [Phycisphaerales bacterium]
MSELATLTHDGAIATLTLNRVEQRNALSVELLDALHARMDEVEQLDDVRVLVVTGAGKAFCAGMDLKQVVIAESGDPGLPLRLLRSLGELTLRLRRLPAVTLAGVNGAAIGGGCGLSCVCDISVTHEGAKLGFPEVDLGLCPAVVAAWVVRKVGGGMARKILLTGGLIEPREALRVGLVNHVVASRNELDSRVGEIAARLASASGAALAATKNLLNELDGSLDDAVVRRGAKLSAEVLSTAEAQGALAARLH